MNTITTNQAAQLALKLYKEGKLSTSAIGKELFKAGYVSFRTGKAISGPGVIAMVRKLEKGEPIADRNPHKRSKVYKRFIATQQKRESRARLSGETEFSLKPGAVNRYCVERIESPAPATRPEKLTQNVMNEENQARAVMKKAMERVLETMFGVKAQVALPLDRSFRVTHA